MPDGQHRASKPGEQRRASRADGQHLAGRTSGPHLASWPDERQGRFRPVECDRCGTMVQVAKFSPQHTSVQWSEASVRACAEFTARVSAGEQSALIDSCASLRDSIDRAVLQGSVEVFPP
jgi:hypothetical protein